MARPRKNNLPVRMQFKRGIYYHTPVVDGKTKWVHLGTDKKMALRKHRALEEGGYTIDDALDEYWRRKQGLSEASIRDYQRHTETLSREFGHVLLDDLDTDELDLYIEERGYIANREMVVLSGAYRYAKKLKWCKVNPCRDVEKAKEPRRVRAVLVEEVRAVKKLSPPWLQDVISVAVATGLRIEDIIALDERSVTEEGLLSYALKPDRPVLFKWNKTLKALSYPLKNSQGNVANYYAISSAWKRARRKAGVHDLQFKDLRRFTLQQVNAKGGLEAARHHADHTDAQTTRLYLAGSATVITPYQTS